MWTAHISQVRTNSYFTTVHYTHYTVISTHTPHLDTASVGIVIQEEERAVRGAVLKWTLFCSEPKIGTKWVPTYTFLFCLQSRGTRGHRWNMWQSLFLRPDAARMNILVPPQFSGALTQVLYEIHQWMRLADDRVTTDCACVSNGGERAGVENNQHIRAGVSKYVDNRYWTISTGGGSQLRYKHINSNKFLSSKKCKTAFQ